MRAINLPFNVRNKEVINADKGNINDEVYETEIKNMSWPKYSQANQDMKTKKEFLEV